jgi:hypothetical protein
MQAMQTQLWVLRMSSYSQEVVRCFILESV